MLEDVILCLPPRSWDGAELGQGFLGQPISQNNWWIASFLREQSHGHGGNPEGLPGAGGGSSSLQQLLLRGFSGIPGGEEVRKLHGEGHGRSHPPAAGLAAEQIFGKINSGASGSVSSVFSSPSQVRHRPLCPNSDQIPIPRGDPSQEQLGQ